MTKTTTKRQRKKRLRADDPLTALRKAMKRLDKGQGVVGRRNARSAVSAELRRLRSFVDREYPAMRTKAKPRKRKTGHSLYRHLCRTGWVDVGNVSARGLVAVCAEAGIKVRRVTTTDVVDGDTTHTLIPDWVPELWGLPNASVSMLRKARRSKVEREALLMEAVFQKQAANDA